MAVQPTDLIQPAGELHLELFPTLSTQAAVEALLDQYITQGEGEAAAQSIPSGDTDKAVTAWAYYRAYMNVYQRLLATPADATNTGQGTRRYDIRQAQGFLELATQKKGEFDGLVPEVVTAPLPANPPSASFKHGFSF